MITRSLIRIKVIQILYSYMLTRPDKTVKQALKDLQTSLDKSYELYHYLLKLPVELTHMQEMRLDEARHKYLPTDEELNPNLKFVNNRVVAALTANEELKQYAADHTVTWMDDPIFMHLMLDTVTRSEVYQDYMADAEDSMAADSNVWQRLLRHVILRDKNMLEQVELKSVYWTIDDLEIMCQFACKTMRRLAEGHSEPIMPMFKDEEDSQFGEQLFLATIDQMEENDAVLDQLLEGGRWDASRIVLMDRIIMCTTLTEVRSFDKIPLPVTLNEYIEIAKSYSTAASGQFVNGLVNSAIRVLREQGKVWKPD